jgi:hypothetical protein
MTLTQAAEVVGPAGYAHRRVLDVLEKKLMNSGNNGD